MLEDLMTGGETDLMQASWIPPVLTDNRPSGRDREPIKNW